MHRQPPAGGRQPVQEIKPVIEKATGILMIGELDALGGTTSR